MFISDVWIIPDMIKRGIRGWNHSFSLASIVIQHSHLIEVKGAN